MQAQLEQLEQQYGIAWREYRLGDLFNKIIQGRRLKKQDQIKGTLPFVMSGVTNTGVVDYIGNQVQVFPANSLTVDIFGNVFYRDYEYGMGDDTGAFWNTDNRIPKDAMLYIASTMQKFLSGKFDYGHKLRSSRAHDFKIVLPTITLNGEPQLAFDFMEAFIATLKAERIATLKAYLKATGLNNYALTDREQAVLDKLDKVQLGVFRFGDLFDNIVQGRRLKKQDQILGDLPFVMSGVTNTGVVDYIGNQVQVFPANSITVDIFGNVFYRSYEYGMGDDTGAFWNASNYISQKSMLFIASVMQKFLSGKFDYGHKLRSSRSHDFEIRLPIKPDQTPDYEFMAQFISAMQKVVIKNVVDYADQNITTHQAVIAN